MIIETRQAAPVTFYRSSIMSAVETTEACLGETIAWADANPVVWKIIAGGKSRAFGTPSNFYLGGRKGMLSPDAILFRVQCFKRECERPEEDFHGWKARFTLAHHGDKGFTGGFFQQWDAEYSRGCAECDYTPETRDSVIDRFLAWCDVGFKFETRGVSVDKKSVPFAIYQDGEGVVRREGVIPEKEGSHGRRKK